MTHLLNPHINTRYIDLRLTDPGGVWPLSPQETRPNCFPEQSASNAQTGAGGCRTHIGEAWGWRRRGGRIWQGWRCCDAQERDCFVDGAGRFPLATQYPLNYNVITKFHLKPCHRDRAKRLSFRARDRFAGLACYCRAVAEKAAEKDSD